MIFSIVQQLLLVLLYVHVCFLMVHERNVYSDYKEKRSTTDTKLTSSPVLKNNELCWSSNIQYVVPCLFVVSSNYYLYENIRINVPHHLIGFTWLGLTLQVCHLAPFLLVPTLKQQSSFEHWILKYQ